MPGAGGSALPLVKDAIANGELFRDVAFEYACRPPRHRSPHHHLTKGQVERMNRTIKDATVKRFTSNPRHQTPGTKHLGAPRLLG